MDSFCNYAEMMSPYQKTPRQQSQTKGRKSTGHIETVKIIKFRFFFKRYPSFNKAEELSWVSYVQQTVKHLVSTKLSMNINIFCHFATRLKISLP